MNSRVSQSRPRSTARTVALLSLGALILVFALVFAGCGSTTDTTSPGDTTGATDPGATGDVQVVMRNTAYDPATVTINAGDTVTWVNEDAPKHDVVGDSGEFQSNLLDLGQAYSFTFTQAGTYRYHCSVHSGMKGTVIVQ